LCRQERRVGIERQERRVDIDERRVDIDAHTPRQESRGDR
jgi:hypothetical protein